MVSCSIRPVPSRMYVNVLAIVVGIAALAAPVRVKAWSANGDPITQFLLPFDVLPQEVQLLPDGSGGVLILWEDLRKTGAYRHVYMMRLTSAGQPAVGWPAGSPLVVCDAAIQQRNCAMASDGLGGAYVCWVDSRNNLTTNEIYAQHVLGSGAIDGTWPVNGALVCGVAGPKLTPRIVADGLGHLILGWLDFRCPASTPALYLQRINCANGAITSPVNYSSFTCTDYNEGGVCPPGASFIVSFSLTTDGTGSAVAAWERASPFVGDIWVQKIMWSGSSVDFPWINWYGGAFALNASRPRIDREPTGGYWLSYSWTPTGSGTSDIVYAHLNVAGQLDIGPNVVCAAPGPQLLPHLTRDSESGSFVAWQDGRVSSSQVDLFASRAMYGIGVPSCWPVNGAQLASNIAVDNAAAEPYDPVILSDGRDGLLCVYTPSSLQLAASHLREDGTLDPAFPKTLNSLPSVSGGPIAVRTEPGAMIAVWIDRRTAGHNAIFANRLSFAIPSGAGVTSPLSISMTGRHTLLVNWTGPAAHPTYGPATYFDLRVAGGPLDDGNFGVGQPVGMVPSGGPPGTPYCITVLGLAPCTNYYLAVRAVYGCGHYSFTQTVSGSTRCNGSAREVDCGGSARAQPAPSPAGDIESLELSAVTPTPSRSRGRVEYSVPAEMNGSALEPRAVRRGWSPCAYLCIGGSSYGPACAGSRLPRIRSRNPRWNLLPTTTAGRGDSDSYA